MELFIIIVLLLVFTETTILSVKAFVSKNRRFGQKPRRKVFIDTSTLMDGRILAVAKTGFLGDELLIPRSVIRELQLLADGNDSDKRARARYALDLVNELERVELADVSIYSDDIGRVKVDERLIQLAKDHHGIIMTNDFNLMKVATTEHIDAINVNELAQSLRSEFLPGDHLHVKVVSVGSNPHQGVAYLLDGTMIVIDDGEKYASKNEQIEIEFVRYLQTTAGKMMFARIVKNTNKQKPRKTFNKRKNSSK